MRALGSSPLTRGKRPQRNQEFRRWRLIPAHAGKTVLPGLSARTRMAHPRSRGENIASRASWLVIGGSSPLTRGKLLMTGNAVKRIGLIPAHAGKTLSGSARANPRRAHPRSRGENGARESSHRPAPGSSPLTRGKQTSPCPASTTLGLIPAHAGKTSPRRALLACLWAHPRSRGENHDPRRLRPLMPGSSPLTRGKRKVQADTAADVGLIPAHAGKTDHGATGGARSGAHPRSRGENP